MPAMNCETHRTRSAIGCRRMPSAFTLVEMLVVIGVITLLLGLLLPALSSVNNSARKTRELSAARQAMQGYTMYANNNADHVLPGYLDGLSAYGPDKQPLPNDPSAWRYLWRLAPYLDYNAGVLFANAHNERYTQWLNQDDYYSISLYPSLGLNTYWVGGHKQFLLDPGEPTAFVWGKFWVSRLSEVRHTDRLIVFGSARGQTDIEGPEGGQTTLYDGFHEIRSPYFLNAPDGELQWVESYVQANTPADFGNMALRFNNQAVTTFVDGHTALMSERQLKDMRHWANGATSEDWLPEPDLP